MGVIEDAAREIGTALRKHNERHTAQVAYIRKIPNDDNHWVEAELDAESTAADDGGDQYDLGKRINVWVWDTAELNVGDPLFVQRRPGDHQRWIALGHQGIGKGQRYKHRDANPHQVLYRERGDHIRPKRVPQNLGDAEVLNKARKHFRLQNSTYLQLQPILQFRVAPNHTDQAIYQLWAYPTIEKIDFDSPPNWVTTIDTPDVTFKRWDTTVDLTAPDQAWLLDQDEVLFVLAYVRVGTGLSLRPKDTGTIRQAYINLISFD